MNFDKKNCDGINASWMSHNPKKAVSILNPAQKEHHNHIISFLAGPFDGYSRGGKTEPEPKS